MNNFDYDAIVIGSGHAGCEAALALSRMGKKTLMTTLNLDSIAFLACNPSIGGTAKGQLASEVDALGGEMGIIADKSLLQLRMLNQGKGPAVQSLRAQVDKVQYHNEMKQVLENEDNLFILQAEVAEILVEDGKVVGVKTSMNEIFNCSAVVVATGVYLNSKVIIGEFEKYTGPNGFEPATRLTKNLIDLGIEIRRFKTGTPARIDGKYIDYSQFEACSGEEFGGHFSYLTKGDTNNTHDCYLGYTNLNTHEIIRNNLSRAPMFSGKIKGIGPRYCPSIEDKVVRFADRERHQLFLEPESKYTHEIYVQGISTSLPADIQRKMYASIKGLENADIMRFAYAIEYDSINAIQLDCTLQLKTIHNLFFAGQINGTSGYEEAAAQGIIAGINASLSIDKKPPFVLKRDEAYIGVLIDDLITKNIVEPYRMMTARAEYRLVLRQDNCDLRLTEKGYNLGLASQERYDLLQAKLKQIELAKTDLSQRFSPSKLQELFISHNETVPKAGLSVYDIIKRPNITIFDCKNVLGLFSNIDDNILHYLNTEIKYEGYIKREKEIIQKNRQAEENVIPDIDYSKLNGLRIEARQKLNAVKPSTIGQASRIDGVSPADINVLMLYLKMKGKNNDRI